MMKEELTLPAKIFRPVLHCASPRPSGCGYSSVTRWWPKRRIVCGFSYPKSFSLRGQVGATRHQSKISMSKFLA